MTDPSCHIHLSIRGLESYRLPYNTNKINHKVKDKKSPLSTGLTSHNIELTLKLLYFLEPVKKNSLIIHKPINLSMLDNTSRAVTLYRYPLLVCGVFSEIKSLHVTYEYYLSAQQLRQQMFFQTYKRSEFTITQKLYFELSPKFSDSAVISPIKQRPSVALKRLVRL